MLINPEPALTEVGGKAYQLNRLKQLCNVPPFFIVKFDRPDEINEPEKQERVTDYFRSRRFTSVAVRSSATVEDSPAASYAGMFETVLNVSADHLIAAMQSVIGSVNNHRVIDYCDAVGFDHRQIQMAIIVQQMVSSRVSGVCFTRFRKDDDNLIIEACLGLGEALVSGRVTPDAYFVHRQTFAVESEKIGYQSVWLPPSGPSQRSYEQLPFFKRTAKKLTNSEIKEIAETSLMIEGGL